MLDFFQYSFIIRGLEAGILIAIIAPAVGIFLVLRRYSLLADTLAHVSLAGVAIGLLTGVHPLITAIIASGGSALAMERLRTAKRVYGDTALSLFLSGSLAVALILLGLGDGFNTSLFGYLFGSILTVTATDLLVIGLFAVIVAVLLPLFFKELLFITFDEEAAIVAGLPVGIVNAIFITLAAVVIAISIPIVGILLVSALMVIPVVSALQLKKGFRTTLFLAQAISVAATVAGIFASWFFNVPAGAAIVLGLLAVFAGIALFSGSK